MEVMEYIFIIYVASRHSKH